MAKFETGVLIQAASPRIFDFLTRPASVVDISPPEMGIRLLEFPEILTLGSRVEFEVTGFGPAQRVVHEIIHHQPHELFTEIQIEGPLKSFVHEHHLIERAEGVEVVDRIEFEPPGGMLGFLLSEAVIRKSLEGSFEHRQRELKTRMEQA